MQIDPPVSWEEQQYLDIKHKLELLEADHAALVKLVEALPKYDAKLTISVAPDPNMKCWLIMPLLIRCISKEQAEAIAALLTYRQRLQ